MMQNIMSANVRIGGGPLFAMAVFLNILRVNCLPAWTPSNLSVPQINDCLLEGETNARFNQQLNVSDVYVGSRLYPKVVHWVRPQCFVSGDEVRIDAFLDQNNTGELGLADGNCGNKVDLIHKLKDTWVVFWHLLYTGKYVVCHRMNQTEAWVEQTAVRLLPPTAQYCSTIFKADMPYANYGSVRCEFPDGWMMPFYDGFISENTSKPHKCIKDCQTCLAEGGRCICHDGIGSTCGVCKLQCAVEDLIAKRCDCVTPTAAANVTTV
jgi:hypothetical protein